MMRLLRRLSDERGLVLPIALGILAVLSISVVTVVDYSSANSRSSYRSKADQNAFVLAEAGINNAMAVLANPFNNALDEYLLPERVTPYEGGQVRWSGVLDKAIAVWTLTSIGEVRNPAGGSAQVTRKLTAKVPVTPTTTQPLNNPSWNYIMSTSVSGGDCDMTIGNTVEVKTNLYVFGNLCLQNQAKVLKGETNPTVLVVKGKVTQYSTQNTVGTSSAPISEVSIGSGCKWHNNAFYNPCITGDNTKVYATTFSTTPATVIPPIADFNSWYLNAAPGPYFPCTAVSGTPPTFDSPVANGSASDEEKLAYKNNNLTVVNLTGASSYSCEVAGGGELSWDATNKVLTVDGTVYIDGDAMIQFAAHTLVSYDGHGTLYLSGSFKMKNAKLCAAKSGSNCDFNGWDPNEEMIAFVAGGDNRQGEVGAGVGIQLLNSQLQGALYATHKINIDTFSKVDGPMVGSEVVLGQSVTTSDFPTITTVPAGMPGNPTVYSQPNPPESFSG